MFIVCVERLVVLNAPFPNGESAFHLLPDKGSPLGHFAWCNFCLVFMRYLRSLSRKSHKMRKSRVDIWRNHLMSVIVLEGTCG